MSSWLLDIEIIPNASWGITLANKLPKENWDIIRKAVYKEANYTCIKCGETDASFHCHEVWNFDDKKLTQTLKGFWCLCKMCHDCIHYGRSQVTYPKSYIKKLIKHMAKVNKTTEADVIYHIEYIRNTHRSRLIRKYRVIVGNREA